MTDPFAPPPAGGPVPERPVVEPPPFGEPVPVGRNNGLGTASLVLGLFSLLVIPGLLGLVFGVVGRRRARRGEANNGGVALAGIILSGLGLAVSALIIALAVSIVRSPAFDDFRDCYDSAGSSVEQNACIDRFAEDLTD